MDLVQTDRQNRQVEIYRERQKEDKRTKEQVR